MFLFFRLVEGLGEDSEDFWRMACFSTLCCKVLLEVVGGRLIILSLAIFFLCFGLGGVLSSILFWNRMLALIRGEVIVLAVDPVNFVLVRISVFLGSSLISCVFDIGFWTCLHKWLWL